MKKANVAICFFLSIGMLLSANYVPKKIYAQIQNKNQMVALANSALNENEAEDETIQVLSTSSKNYYITKDDVTLIAKVVYAESRGEPYDGQVAVASVILNRLKSGKYSDKLQDIIFQKNAFSCVQNGEIKVTPTESNYMAVYDAIEGNDPSGNALYFYNPQTATCSWMHSIEKINPTQIGNHVFFSLN